MDMGFFRGLVTAVLFIAFCLLVYRTYSRKRKGFYEEAARIPLEEDSETANSVEQEPEK